MLECGCLQPRRAYLQVLVGNAQAALPFLCSAQLVAQLSPGSAQASIGCLGRLQLGLQKQMVDSPISHQTMLGWAHIDLKLAVLEMKASWLEAKGEWLLSWNRPDLFHAVSELHVFNA